MSTKTKEHVWVKHVITPVAVIVEGEEYSVFVDPDVQDDSESNAAYGCQICNQPMATHFNTECDGPDEEVT